jgi:hypothetical protein
MIEWVLLLTLAAGDSRGGVSIHEIGGFANVKERQDAAKAWKQSIAILNDGWTYTRGQAACFPRAGAQPTQTRVE